MRVDLHNHSTYSDGLYSIDVLCDKAIENKVSVLAITDHDCVINSEKTLQIGIKKNIRIILGIEVSTSYKGKSVHLIGLFKNNIVPKNIELYYKDIISLRRQRAIDMINKIVDIYHIKFDLTVFDNMNIITRGNMFNEIVRQNDIDPTLANFYVSSKSKAYIPMFKYNVEEGIKFLRENNALCILAHPTLIEEDIIDEVLKNHRFDGIEARYPKNKENDFEKFSEYAKVSNIFISAGSDCHGDIAHSEVGSATLSLKEFQIIDKYLKGE